ncbi:MAG: hypothetical protein Q8N36_05000, partial [bacterium]|nr:hypothetical protein [bacterium]
EIMVTELIFAGVLDDLSEPLICSLFFGIDYPWRKIDVVTLRGEPQLQKWWTFISSISSKFEASVEMVYTAYLSPIGFMWANGLDLREIVESCNIDEGDIVSLLRREIDLFRQMRHALKSTPLYAEKLNRCIALLDRDLVKIVL